MESYELYLEPAPPQKGKFKKGCRAWNKGMSWDEQGWSEERKTKVITQLRVNISKNTHTKSANHFKHPVIQMDEYGNRLHWYESSEAAARKLGLTGRNIRKVCDCERLHCGGYRWKWDENFKPKR